MKTYTLIFTPIDGSPGYIATFDAQELPAGLPPIEFLRSAVRKWAETDAGAHIREIAQGELPIRSLAAVFLTDTLANFGIHHFKTTVVPSRNFHFADTDLSAAPPKDMIGVAGRLWTKAQQLLST